MLRSLLHHRRGPVTAQGLASSLGRKPAVRTPSRGFATAGEKPKSPRKWQKPALLLATGLVGGYVFLNRTHPALTESKRLLKLVAECVKKGDVDQALKYNAESFAVIKAALPHGNVADDRMLYAIKTCATICEVVGRDAAALPYYMEALEIIPLISSPLERAYMHMDTLMSISSCYQNSGHPKAAERAYRQAIDVYDQFQGQASLSQTEEFDVNLRLKLDSLAIAALTKYALLLMPSERSDEISQARQRVVMIVRGSSPQSLNKEETVMDAFDDLVALEKIRLERLQRREHGEGSDAAF